MIVGGVADTGDGLTVPAGLPAEASLRRVSMTCGEELLLVVVPLENAGDEQSDQRVGLLTESAAAWVAAAPRPIAPVLPVVMVPLYGCHVALTPGRAAVLGPPARLELLVTAIVEFANCEGELRLLEQRCACLLETLDGDACHAFECDEQSVTHRAELAARFRESVAILGRLAVIAPAVHAPPVHPPTLASQLGERLRDRTRLAERHEFAVDRAELAERLYEACGQRAAEFGIARRQMGLEWAIVVLLVIQTALLLVDLLAWRGTR